MARVQQIFAFLLVLTVLVELAKAEQLAPVAPSIHVTPPDQVEMDVATTAGDEFQLNIVSSGSVDLQAIQQQIANLLAEGKDEDLVIEILNQQRARQEQEPLAPNEETTVREWISLLALE